MVDELRVLELFSGIGGMHYALQYAALPINFKVIAALDINTIANAVYKHNHTTTLIKNNNVQSLTAAQLTKMNVNTLLMSPPCQPHTRQGLQRDLEDKRSDALQHLCTILPACTTLQYVLMENVKGFEASAARAQYVEALSNAGYHWREFILTPTQFGVPNTRHRYYCLARKQYDFPFESAQLWTQMPPIINDDRTVTVHKLNNKSVADVLDVANEAVYQKLPNDVLNKRVWLLDIVNSNATNTMCFTKGYTHYSEGTGSVFTPLDKTQIDEIFVKVKQIEVQLKTILEDVDQVAMLTAQRLKLLQQLELRYFTAHEVARLMCFPDSFDFPAETTVRQKYRLLGNSINVRVVGELLKLLLITLPIKIN